jgi:hypothetical protein
MSQLALCDEDVATGEDVDHAEAIPLGAAAE